MKTTRKGIYPLRRTKPYIGDLVACKLNGYADFSYIGEVTDTVLIGNVLHYHVDNKKDESAAYVSIERIILL